MRNKITAIRVAQVFPPSNNSGQMAYKSVFKHIKSSLSENQKHVGWGQNFFFNGISGKQVFWSRSLGSPQSSKKKMQNKVLFSTRR